MIFLRFIIPCLTTLFFINPSPSSKQYYSYTLNDFRKAKPFLEEINTSGPDLSRLNAVIFYITNEERSKKKLKILAYEGKLEESAALHSKSMVDQHFFDHTNKKSKKLRTPNDRAKYVGIKNPFLAENIMETFVLRYTPGKPVYPGEKGVFSYKAGGEPIGPHTYLSLGEALVEGWMNSPGHRKNILSPDAVQLGCGTAVYYKKDFNNMPTVMATQNFQLYVTVTTDAEGQ
jgi:uncharacterized protein YkwD